MSTRVEDLQDYKAAGMRRTVKALLREDSIALRPAQTLSSMQHCVAVGTVASQNHGHADSLIEARKQSKRWEVTSKQGSVKTVIVAVEVQ